MSPEIKLQLFFSVVLCITLIGMFMVLARTLAGLEYSLGRIDEIIDKELHLAQMQLLREKEASKITANQIDRHSRNDLLLNIPFMDTANTEKPKNKPNGKP